MGNLVWSVANSSLFDVLEAKSCLIRGQFVLVWCVIECWSMGIWCLFDVFEPWSVPIWVVVWCCWHLIRGHLMLVWCFWALIRTYLSGGLMLLTLDPWPIWGVMSLLLSVAILCFNYWCFIVVLCFNPWPINCLDVLGMVYVFDPQMCWICVH